MLRRAAGALLPAAWATAPIQRLPHAVAGFRTSAAAPANPTDSVKDTVSRVAEKIHDATERAKETLKGAADTAGRTINEYTGRGQEGIERSKEAAHDMKERAKQRVSDYAEATREGLQGARDVAAEAASSATSRAKETFHDAQETVKGSVDAGGERIRSAAKGEMPSSAEGGATVEDRSDVLGSTTPGDYGVDEAARATGRIIGEEPSLPSADGRGVPIGDGGGRTPR